MCGLAYIVTGEVTMAREIEIHIGDRRLGLNRFAKELIINTLTGLLGSLKHADVEQQIVIKIGAVKE
jgi:hypothetical protein